MATAVSITTASRFHNLSPAMLADLIGQLDKQAKSASAELDIAKEAFKARGLLVAEGDAFAIVLQKTIRATLDTANVKAEMGQPWYDDHCKLAEVSSLRISAAKPAAIAA